MKLLPEHADGTNVAAGERCQFGAYVSWPVPDRPGLVERQRRVAQMREQLVAQMEHRRFLVELKSQQVVWQPSPPELAWWRPCHNLAFSIWGRKLPS